jgi:predicted NAD/FAD-dependent oxidoreductase
MPIAIIGSGPAGLTAAHRLQQAGHRATVFEAQTVIGGRTHAQHFGPDHHCDTGAGWLASFYLTHLMRWRWAVPIMAPGHYRLLANYTRQPPIVFAGDWTQQACVEGAVRSGEAAAQAFG